MECWPEQWNEYTFYDPRVTCQNIYYNYMYPCEEKPLKNTGNILEKWKQKINKSSENKESTAVTFSIVEN